MAKNIITEFYVRPCTVARGDGTTHEVRMRRTSHGSQLNTLVHRAVCENEANDVCQELNAALSRAAYVFE